MGETNSPSVAHVGYDISRKLNWNFYPQAVNLSLEWRNIVTHGQLKENIYIQRLKPSYNIHCHSSEEDRSKEFYSTAV
jgi:hypothetical protein